jgi:carbon storage regulator
MLVFTRKRDEAIVIGDGIEVRVLRTGRDGVKLGITAPLSVAVHRREIYDLIRAENEGAVHHPSDVEQLIARLRRQSSPNDIQ